MKKETAMTDSPSNTALRFVASLAIASVLGVLLFSFTDFATLGVVV